MSTTSAADDSTESQSISANRDSFDLGKRRSVTVPSSLADSAISLSTVESSSALSSDDKSQPGDVSRPVLHNTVPRQHVLVEEDDVLRSSSFKDKRKKIGLSRLLKSKQKDMQ